MSNNFKKEAEIWAEKELAKYSIKEKLDKQLIEFTILGSLIFKVNKNGEKVWIERLTEER